MLLLRPCLHDAIAEVHAEHHEKLAVEHEWYDQEARWVHWVAVVTSASIDPAHEQVRLAGGRLQDWRGSGDWQHGHSAYAIYWWFEGFHRPDQCFEILQPRKTQRLQPVSARWQVLKQTRWTYSQPITRNISKLTPKDKSLHELPTFRRSKLVTWPRSPVPIGPSCRHRYIGT